MDDEQSGSTYTLSADSQNIPGYLTYFILVYRLFSAVFVIGMSGLIVSTIIKVRALHNVHNIFIANLMVSNIVVTAATTFQTTGMMFSYIFDIQDLFRCDVLYLLQFPFFVIVYTFVMLSVDKVIAIKFTLRYNSIVTRRRAYIAIAICWIIALLFRIIRLIYELTTGIEYDKSSQFGSCFIEQQQSLLVSLFTSIFPIFLACAITIILDVYLSIKAYQMYKKIQKESGEEIEVFKDKLNQIFRQLKPMITLLVTILGSLAITVIASVVYIYAKTLRVENESYQTFLKHILVYNLGVLSSIVHPVVYGLYFRDIRRPLCNKVKRIVQSCKFNAIAPNQP